MAGWGASWCIFQLVTSFFFPNSLAGVSFPLLSNDLWLFAVGTSESWLRFKSLIQGERGFFQVAEALRPAIWGGSLHCSGQEGFSTILLTACLLRPFPGGMRVRSVKSLRDLSWPLISQAVEVPEGDWHTQGHTATLVVKLQMKLKLSFLLTQGSQGSLHSTPPHSWGWGSLISKSPQRH